MTAVSAGLLGFGKGDGLLGSILAAASQGREETLCSVARARRRVQRQRSSRVSVGISGGETDISGCETAAPEDTFFDPVGPKLGWLGVGILSFGVNLHLVLQLNFCRSVEN